MIALEFITSKIPDFLISVKQAEQYLELRGVNASQQVDTSAPSFKNIELALVDCYFYILRLPNSISQGGFSLSSVDKDVYKAEIKAIFNKYGLEDELALLNTAPNITTASEWN